MKIIQNNPVVSFVILAFLIGFAVVIPLILSMKKVGTHTGKTQAMQDSQQKSHSTLKAKSCN